MGLRAWSDRLDRRAQDTYRRPYVGPLYLAVATAFALYALLLSASPAVPLTLAAVWAVLGTVALVARARARR